MARFDLNQHDISLSEEDDVYVSNSIDLVVSSSNNTGSSNIFKTPKSVIHREFIDTPSGSVYCVPRVSASVLPVLGTVYENLEECISKYIVCNREGCPKDVCLDTLDPKKNDRQVRSSNFRICGCKARVVFDMVHNTTKYTMSIFDVEHNHELDRVEYKHLSKAKRKLTYAKQSFILKGANANFGAVRAYNLYIGLKWSSSPVHGRLKKETSEAYGWLLRAFRKAFIQAPNIVVTDQDGAMRLVVAAEFPESTHRLCMCHIIQKIPSKIVSRIYDETDFKAKFGKIIWNMFIGPEEFEDRWNKLMKEFNLVNHKWLSKMYHIRSSWILAFFSGSTLVKFMLCYESTMERQRYMQDHQSFESFPSLLTPLPIELHVAKVYTHSLFTRVQTKIVAGSWLCSIKAISSDEGCDICVINEEKPKPKPVAAPKVIDKESTSENVKEEEINLHQKVIIICFDNLYEGTKNRYGGKNEGIETLAIEASIIVDSCVHMLSTNEPKFTSLVNKMKALKAEVEADLPIVPTRTVLEIVQEFMGVKKPVKINVKNPSGVKTKGREKEKRIKSGREISIGKRNKKKNGCGIYGSTDHSGCTCPGKGNADVLYSVGVVSGGGDHVYGGSRDGGP
nr:hypothetical protein [Tanacetum cinerariifolium]